MRYSEVYRSLGLVSSGYHHPGGKLWNFKYRFKGREKKLSFGATLISHLLKPGNVVNRHGFYWPAGF